jgi:hypothetical protein
MPIREKRIYSGKYLEVEIYPITKQEQKQKRGKKKKVSLNKQKNLNDKNAKKHFVRVMHENFTDEDIALHLTYDKNNLPKDEEEAKRKLKNYFARVSRRRKRKGLEPLRYMVVTEYKEATEDKRTRTRIHHHVVISGGIDRDELEKMWGHGRANADRLKADEFGYEALAKYMMKDPKGKKRWSGSRNLKQPIIKVNDYKYSHRKAWELSKCQGDREVFEKLYPGYTYTNYKVDVNEINAGTYIYIKMRKLN